VRFSSETKVEHLGRHEKAIPEIVSWVYAEWGHRIPGVSSETLTTAFQKRLTSHRIPETLIALVDEQIVGTASIVHHDMSTRMELSPWLAAVYVKSEFRGQGIGSKLVQAIMDESAFLGVKRLFLFTPDQALFYARLGWQVSEETEYRGEQVTVMEYLF
jgi:N-acetylglutamate synthase-like GNAT family acetyltransferase